MTYSTEEKLADAFLILGVQYYIIARHAAFEFIEPTCANLYHHAVEMLVKGCLVKKMGLAGLKKIGHSLQRLWIVFKDNCKDSSLDAFDFVISDLDKFEEIRYPEKLISDDLSIEISIGPGPSLSSSLLGRPPKYTLDVEKLDDLVSAIFSFSPLPSPGYFRNMPKSLTRDIPRNLIEGTAK
jgi:hypothetical protein